MPETRGRKARLIELDDQLQELPEGQGRRVDVQFNPDSLKLQFANQIQNNQPSTGGSGGSGGGGGSSDQGTGNTGRQFVGAGTTKLAVQLWFDAAAGADGQRVDDVRELTQKVVYFIRPKALPDDATKFVPPGVRFAWGSFIFDGLVDGIEETIEFFSPDGHPLRASLSLSLSQQTILLANLGDSARPAGAPRGPGTSPLAAAAAGSTLQGLAAAAGGDWQRIAAANGIDNPRALVPGQLIDLRAAPPRSLF
ncbi:MAG: LysM peptidoglycan-binding domain-containing protein [Piscinibacter sp.]|uniref:CIS tube protein n=1 Tax=Piscinibacter sp. TaxID=1903157 RepID=UPI00258ED79B|nr:LysM peptidoglycan-binding domain-containing protein [Piscinibacter sp.]MCW5665819.1 LysM peptidoglycan-binding domain-containing protein [Piscinibacter sp.]